MSERITSEQVQSDVESYALRASPDGRRRVIREALDKARREGGEDAQAEVARLKAQMQDVCEANREDVDGLTAMVEQERAEVARLREVIATKYAIERSSLGVSALVEERATIALAAGLGADATAEEVAARVGEMARTLSLIGTWRHEHGAALKPSRADTYGDGMRDAKQQVGAILSRLAEDHKLAPQPCEDPDRCGMSMRYCGPCARRLAEEAGRDEVAAALGADMARMAALGEALLKGGGRG